MKQEETATMQNTAAKDTLRKYVKEDEIALTKGNEGMLKKGDTFVQYEPRHSIIFMIVNYVEHTKSMDFCTVTWHILDAKGINVQRRFPMAAPNGMFSGFLPIKRIIHKEAVTLLLDCDDKIKVANSDSEKKALVQKYRRKLIGLTKNI